MDGWKGELIEARRPRIEDMVINEWEPSRRLPDHHLHQLWSEDSQEEQHQDPAPVWARQDAVLQYLIAQPTAPTVDNSNNPGASPGVHEFEMQSSTELVEDYYVVTQSTTELVAKTPNQRTTPRFRARGNSSNKRAGKGAVRGRENKRESAKPPLRGPKRAPSTKRAGRKQQSSGAVPSWLRSLLQQPTQTRSQCPGRTKSSGYR
ncbi:MAG: hypothetical protein Q9181_007986 [Wetmoreana brouardii]